MKNRSTINCEVALPYQRGFHIAFANGYTVSVQFGTGSYCDVRSYDPDARLEGAPPAGSVEIGIFNTESGVWVQLTEHDDVAGHVPVDLIPDILTYAQNGHWGLVRVSIADAHGTSWHYDPDKEKAESA